MELSNRRWLNLLVVILMTVMIEAMTVEDEQVMSIEIRNVAPGYRNTEFVHKVQQLNQDAMFIKRVEVQLDETVVHHFEILVCNNSTLGTFM